jgi:uncharacterized protein (DUF58 family)
VTAPDNNPITSYLSKIATTEPTGFILHRFGLLVLVVLLVLAAWGGLTAIVVVLGLALAAAGTAMLWTRLSLRGITYQRFLSENRVFPGESIELKLRLENRKLIPLPWVRLEDDIPAHLAPDISLLPSEYPEYGILSRKAALLWYTAINWHHTLYCGKRGYFRLGPLRVISGDIFGFYSRSMTSSVKDYVIVYPRIFPLDKLAIPSLYPLGETRAERRLFADPTRSIGIREYRPHDSLRHIHWKATARHQDLQVKIFEPTTTLKVIILLAVDSFPAEGPGAGEDFELGVSTAASIACLVNERGSQVGLFVNTRMADSRNPVRIPAGRGTEQLVSILESLAKVTYRSSPFESFVQNERARLPYGATLMFVVSQPSKSFGAVITGLKDNGYKIMVVQVGGPPVDTSRYRIAWHRIVSQDTRDNEA